MDERAKLCPANGHGLSVIVVDEDKHHENSTRSMLCTLNYHGKFLPFLCAKVEPMEESHAQQMPLDNFFVGYI